MFIIQIFYLESLFKYEINVVNFLKVSILYLSSGLLQFFIYDLIYENEFFPHSAHYSEKYQLHPTDYSNLSTSFEVEIHNKS